MPEIAEVVATVEREIKRFGENTEALKQSMQRDVEGLKARDKEIGDATDETIKAMKTEVLAKSEALEKNVQTLDTTVGDLSKQLEQLQVAIKRPGVGLAGEAGARRQAELIHWKTVNLAATDQLRVGTDVAAKADMGEFEQWEAAYRIALRKPRDSLTNEQQKALSVAIDRDGGFLVSPAISARIIQILREVSPLRNFATVETISSDKLEMPRDIGDVTANWVGETQARTETTTPEVGMINIPVHEMYAEPQATQKFLDDASINAEAWLAGKVADYFGRLEATGYVNGNGVNKPEGLLSYPTVTTDDATRAWGTFQHIVSGAATGITADAIRRLPFMLKEGYLANARWMMIRLTVLEVMLLKDGEGRYLWQPSMTEGAPSSLMGYPMATATDFPVLGAGSLSIAFGDFARTYTIVDRLGMTGMRDPYTNKPFVKFYSRRRTGGAAVHFESLKFIKTAAA